MYHGGVAQDYIRTHFLRAWPSACRAGQSIGNLFKIETEAGAVGHKKEELARIVAPASSFAVCLIYGAD
jgi:hypothetical protein